MSWIKVFCLNIPDYLPCHIANFGHKTIIRYVRAGGQWWQRLKSELLVRLWDPGGRNEIFKIRRLFSF